MCVRAIYEKNGLTNTIFHTHLLIAIKMTTRDMKHNLGKRAWYNLLLFWLVCSPPARMAMIIAIVLMGIWAMDVVGDSLRLQDSSQDHLLAAAVWLTS